jgi:hypothetical protein
MAIIEEFETDLRLNVDDDYEVTASWSAVISLDFAMLAAASPVIHPATRQRIGAQVLLSGQNQWVQINASYDYVVERWKQATK